MPRFSNVSYGHRALWFFFSPLFELTGDGFNHAGRHYHWSDLGMIRITQVPVPTQGQGKIVYFGRADVHLSDGTAVRLRAEDVVKRGALLSRGYQSAFDELVSIFQEKRREHVKELEAQGELRDAA
jgi:hypothetical protein